MERIKNLMELIFSVEKFVEPNISIKKNLWNVMCRENPWEHINFPGNFCGTYKFPKKPVWNIKKL